MRIFAIKDDNLPAEKILGYLIYYENARTFYIELPEDADPWDTPLLLSSFLNRGERSIGSYWSRIWVEQRVVPQDRQNLGQILRDNELTEYDLFSLVMLSMGRCAQDDCYLEEITSEPLPRELILRWRVKIEDVIPMDGKRLLAFFRSGEVKVIDMGDLLDKFPSCTPFLQSEERFHRVEVQTDGYGIMWSEQAMISDQALYDAGKPVPLSLNDFYRFVQCRVVNAAEAAAILGCSRQNVDDLMRRGKLHPIRKDSKNKLFLRNEILQRRKV